MVCKRLVCEWKDWELINQTLQEYRVAVVTNFWSDSELHEVKQYQSSVEDWFLHSSEKLNYLTNNADDQGYHQIKEHWINPDYRDYKEGYGFRSENSADSLPPEWGCKFVFIRNKLYEKTRLILDYFNLLNKLSSKKMISYVVHYPPCNNDYPCAPHYDRNIFTMIISHDPHKILQVKYNEQWITVPYLENSVVIMVGMSFQWLTKEKIKACWHQVKATNQSSFSTILFTYAGDLKIDILLGRWKKWKNKRAKVRDSVD